MLKKVRNSLAFGYSFVSLETGDSVYACPFKVLLEGSERFLVGPRGETYSRGTLIVSVSVIVIEQLPRTL